MMDRRTLRLVLLVSCAHALVHVFELGLPSVELRIADAYGVGEATTGMLSTCWRLPWGLGALGAGWLVDRYGCERMLAVYLLGCSAMCLIAGMVIPLPALFAVMFMMGTFACIYHPAGLTLISRATTLENRPRALGIHGIFGSAGIGSAPFLAALLLMLGLTWRQYYLVLAVGGIALGAIFVWRCVRQVEPAISDDPANLAEQQAADWGSFGLLTLLALAHGFVYAAVLSFLPRFLGTWQLGGWSEMSRATRGSLLTGGVLLAGCFGQYLAGRFARARLLELQLALVSFANVPFLVGMTTGHGGLRAAAAAMFAVVHFMHQPLYNSLIAKYTPLKRRSLCYGFSFAMGAGLGSFGAAFNGFSQNDNVTYTVLASFATCAGLVGLLLWRRTRG
jgi:MFS family permease